MKKRSIIKRLLYMCVLTLTVFFEINCNISYAKNYDDVNSNAWYYNAVKYVTDKGIFSGVSTKENIFDPQGKMTRAMVVNALYNIEGKPDVNGVIKYTDIKNGLWYSKPIIWAEQNGIVNGFPDGSFKPNDSVTREMLAVIFNNYVIGKNEKLKEIDIKECDTSRFKDFNASGKWAQDSIKFCVLLNLFEGDNNAKINAKNNVTRAEASTIIMKYDKDKNTYIELVQSINEEEKKKKEEERKKEEEKKKKEEEKQKAEEDEKKKEEDEKQKEDVRINKNSLSGNALAIGNLISKYEAKGVLPENIDNTKYSFTINSSNGTQYVSGDVIKVIYTVNDGYTFKGTNITSESFKTVTGFEITSNVINDKTLQVIYERKNIYSNIETLKNNCANLTSGDKVSTKGYYTDNDGGNGEYEIVEDTKLVDDNGMIIKLAEGKFAKLIYKGTVSLKQFGAYGDGKHDDTIAIQNFVKKLDIVDGIVPDGDYYITASIKMENMKKFNIKGNGKRSRFFVDPTYPKAKGVFVFRYCQNIIVDGICIDCSQDEKYRGDVYNDKDGIQPFDIWNSSYVTIKNCVYQNNIYCAIRGISTSHVTVENNKFLQVDCGFITLGAGNIEDFTLRNNIFEGHQNSEPISFYGQGRVENVLIENNTFKNKYHASAICFANGYGSNIIIRDNLVDNCAVGISMIGSKERNYRNVEIYDNEIIRTYSGSGISIKGCVDTYVHDNKINYTNQMGITIRQSTNVVIANNRLENCAVRGGDMLGLFVSDGNDNVLIAGTKIIKNDESTLTKLALRFDNADNKNIFVFENTFENLKFAISNSSPKTILQIPDKSLKLWGNDTLTYVIKNNIDGGVIVEDNINDMKSNKKLKKDNLVILKNYNSRAEVYLIADEKILDSDIKLSNGLYASKQYSEYFSE